MPCFSVNRKQMNRGCPNGYGYWLIEEFMFSDSCFGRAEFCYDICGIETREVCNAEVNELVIFDDDGNEVTLSDEDRKQAEAVALEAFKECHEAIIEHVYTP